MKKNCILIIVLLLISVLHVSADNQNDTRNYPYLAIRSLDMGKEAAAGLEDSFEFDILPAQVMQFSWEAFANAYGGTIVSYRYGFDIMDPDDPNDPGWAVPHGLGVEFQTTYGFSFYSGIHNMFIECVDNFGNMTRPEFWFTVVPIPAPENRLPLLLIDDVLDHNSNAWHDQHGIPHDNDIYRDSRWLELIGDVLGFDPDRDIIDTEEFPELSLRDLVNYRAVIWATSKAESSFISENFSPFDRKYNWLQKYQQYGGNLLLTGTGATNNFHPTHTLGTDWAYPIFYDSIESYIQCENVRAVGFGEFEDLYFNTSALGLESYPYKSLGVSVMDMASPSYIYECNYQGDRKRQCVGTKAVFLDEEFVLNHGSVNAVSDTIMTWEVIDWADYQDDIPSINQVYSFGQSDEFYNRNITDRETNWAIQTMPDGSPVIEPMWLMMTRYDWILQKQIDAGNTAYPEFAPCDSCGYKAFEANTPPGSHNRTLLDSAMLGFITHAATETKPGGRPDVVWGFDPTKLEPIAMRQSIHWVLNELFNLDIVTSISPDPDPIPDVPPVFATKLWPCHPNPFNPQTTLSYDLHEPGMVNLSIFDAKGRLVAVIVDQPQGAGQHQEVWNGYNDNGAAAPSGVYYLKLVSNNVEQTQNMLLLK
jgi:hypothetical protein